MLKNINALGGDIMKIFAFNETMDLEEKRLAGLTASDEFPPAANFRDLLLKSKSVAIVGNGEQLLVCGQVIRK